MKRLLALLAAVALAGCGGEAAREAPADEMAADTVAEAMEADTMSADTVMVRDTASDVP